MPLPSIEPTVPVRPPTPISAPAEPPVTAVFAPAIRTELPDEPPALTRPRFGLAIGLGFSVDSSGLLGGRTGTMPAFQVTGDVGGDTIGFEAQLTSTQASGRFNRRDAANMTDQPVDRVGVDLAVALRPFVRRHPEDPRWFRRVARSVTFIIGLAGEHDAIGTLSVLRIGSTIGAHVDLPLSPASESSSLSLRLSARKVIASEESLGTVVVKSTGGDLLAGLAVAF